MGGPSVNLKNRQTVLTLIVGIAAALLLLDRLVFTPLTAGWTKRAETIADLRKSINDGKSMIDRENITRAAWNDMRRNTLPANASQAEKSVLEAFDKWSRDSNITVNSIKPQWKRGENEEYSLLECRIDAAGDLGTLSRFIYDVENSEMALRIESVELTSRNSDGKQLALGLSVSGLRLSPLEEQ